MKGRLLSVFFAAFCCIPAAGQKVAISTNLADYANLCTINIDVSLGLDRHWSINAGADYNPFTYREGTSRQFQHRCLSLSVGGRYWPWHINSGWFAGGKAQYSIYNYGGLTSRITEEGRSYTVGIYAGYAIMLATNFNLEIGLGILGGFKMYTKYGCPACGKVLSKGGKMFIYPDNLLIQLAYVF